MKDKITSLSWDKFAYSKSVCRQILVEATVPDCSDHLSVDIVQNRMYGNYTAAL